MPTSSTVWWAPVSRSPLASTSQAEPAVAGEQVEHVVEEADAGRGARLSPVEVERELDLRLGGAALSVAVRLMLIA